MYASTAGSSIRFHTVHVQFRDGSRVSLAIETGALLIGYVSPRKRLEPVRTWIEAHRDVLLTEYRRLNP